MPPSSLRSLVDGLPWALVAAVAPVVERAVPPAALDLAVAALKTHSPLHPYRFYSRGWGELPLLPRIAYELPSLGGGPVPTLAVQLSPSAHGRADALVLEGCVPTPAAHAALLPPECATAHFQLVLPRCWEGVGGGGGSGAGAGSSRAAAGVAGEMSQLRPVAVLLPGTGEQGFRRRRQCVSYPLARLGVASLVLEGPYYGVRRPPAQAASKLLAWTDLLCLGKATVEEARALVGWLQGERGGWAEGCGGGLTGMPAARVERVLGGGGGGGGGGESGDATLGTGIGSGAHTRRQDTSGLSLTDAEAALLANAAADAASALHGGRWGAVPMPPTPPALPAPPTQGASGGLLGFARLPWVGARGSLDGGAAAAIAALSAGTPGFFGPVVLAGTSMGGLHAAMTASHLPARLGARTGVASWLGPPSAAPVFTLGALAGGCDWAALAAGADTGTPAGAALASALDAMEAALASAPSAAAHPSTTARFDHAADVARVEGTAVGRAALEALAAAAAAPTTPAAVSWARRQLCRASRLTDVTLHPPPARPDAAVFTVATEDMYIPRTVGVDAMWGAMKASWRGCDVRLVRGGHVSASVLTASDNFAGTIVEVARRLGG